MTQLKRAPALIAIPREGDRGSPPSPSSTLAPVCASRAHSSEDVANFSSGVILRIKRKRGTEPVDALRIGLFLSEQEENEAAGGSKRRIVEKSRPDESGTVFRLAETVSIQSFSDPKLALSLSSRLAARYPLAATVSPQQEASSRQFSVIAAAASPSATSTPPAHSASGSSIPSHVSSSLRFQVVRPVGGLGYGAFHSRTAPKSVSVEAATGVKMGKARFDSKLRRTSSSVSLSSVKSHSSIRSRPPSRLRIIDAVAVQQGERRKRKNKTASAAVETALAGVDDVDAEMKGLDRKFADMLTDYLAEKDLVPPSDIYDAPLAHASSDEASSTEEDEEDYVYDVYYRDSASAGGLAGLAESGRHPLPVPGHSTAPSIAGPSVPAEIATLEGLRAADLEIDDAETLDMGGGVGSGDEEWDEGEDEDSNDEGFYRNDYPDQEAPDSDEETFGWDGKGEEESDDGSSF